MMNATGTPSLPNFLDPRLIKQHWNKIVPEPNSGCWLWIGATGPTGYGHMNIQGRTQYPHRVLYELFIGPISRGLTIDHRCRTRCCCNPAHLEPVSQHENCIRGRGSKSTCIHGHALDEKNTRIATTSRTVNARFCRQCDAQRARRYRAELVLQRATSKDT